MWLKYRYRIEYDPTYQRYRALRSRVGIFWKQIGTYDEHGLLPLYFVSSREAEACIDEDRKAMRGPQWERVRDVS